MRLEFPLDTFFDRHRPRTATPRNFAVSTGRGSVCDRLTMLILKNMIRQAIARPGGARDRRKAGYTVPIRIKGTYE
jgi:hypothetical protein